MSEPERKDADDFYGTCSNLFKRHEQTGADRSAYREKHPCDLIAAVCMDERERDFGETMGLPFGMPLLIETAGNKLGQINTGVHRLLKRALHDTAGTDRCVLLFFVTHSSHYNPDTDSCAAWGHDTARAVLEAKRQVWQCNHFYSNRPCAGQSRVIAIHLHSYTDLESKCWHSETGTLDPLPHVAHFMEANPFCSDAEFRNRMNEFGSAELEKLFPPHDPRFAGLDGDKYQMVIRQCAGMFAANAAVVRDVLGEKRAATKAGHQGRRILIGDWPLHTEAGPYFKISEFVPDLGTELGIAFKYVLRNRILDAMKDGTRLFVPIHLNLEYDWDLDREGAENRVYEFARLIRAELADLLANPYRSDLFHSGLVHALGQKLPSEVEHRLQADAYNIFVFHTSISFAADKLIERLRAY